MATENIFERTRREREKAINDQSGGTAPAAPPPAKPGFDFFKSGPVDPEVEAARKRQRLYMLRNG